jgi:uracil-DNA glycosylase
MSSLSSGFYSPSHICYIKSWKDFFPDKINFKSLFPHNDWEDIFIEAESLLDEPTQINQLVKDDSEAISFPYPSLVFNTFYLTPLSHVKVVILGQDPYFNLQKNIPEAMGLSFSVPLNVPIPSSLNNIFKNLLKFKHIDAIPAHGNLENWAHQGVLLLNTALTVQHKFPNSHSDEWKSFTNFIIKKISSTNNNVVFILWGNPALSKFNLIDNKKHHVIISSHPSGLSCNNKLKNYSAFVDQDHFGLANSYLISHSIKPIDWNL